MDATKSNGIMSHCVHRVSDIQACLQSWMESSQEAETQSQALIPQQTPTERA